MNVLVTGGAGFVGTNLIKRLVSEGHDVVSVDNYFTGFKTNHIEGAKYVNEDISIRKRNWHPYLDNGGTFDIVYHLAAIARIQPSFKNPVGYFKTNADGTLYVADFCAQNNIPLVYAGSSSHHSGKFKNPYTFSKDVGEEIIQMYQQHFNLKASVSRFYNVYGPHHLKEGGYCTLIGKWEKSIEDGEPLTIYGDGTKRRDFTHIDDIVDGLIRIKTFEKWGHIFELGRGKNYSIEDIAKMFNHEYIFTEDKPGEALITLCDSVEARLLLDWEPNKNIEDYINEYNIRTRGIQ
jgi:UDP-glucose 4-epimerase